MNIFLTIYTFIVKKNFLFHMYIVRATINSISHTHTHTQKFLKVQGLRSHLQKKKKIQGRYSDWWVAFFYPVMQRPPGSIRVVAPHFPRAIACIQLVQDERTGRTCISSSSLCLAESHIIYNHSLGVNQSLDCAKLSGCLEIQSSCVLMKKKWIGKQQQSLLQPTVCWHLT